MAKCRLQIGGSGEVLRAAGPQHRIPLGDIEPELLDDPGARHVVGEGDLATVNRSGVHSTDRKHCTGPKNTRVGALT